MSTQITATLSQNKNQWRVSFITPDGVKRSRTGSLNECVTYAQTKAREHRTSVKFA